MQHLLNESQAAGFLGLAEITLRKYRVTGDGPHFIKMGRSVRYRQEDIDAWVEARRVKSTSQKAAA